MSELSLGVYSESEMSNVFQELKNKGTQYGANFTNNILSGFANKGEG
jgi:hypothetical protein